MIKERIQEAVKPALVAKDKDRVTILRLMLSEFKRIEVDERVELDEARELAILDKMQKQRRDAIAQFQAGGRGELAEKEQYEWDIIQSFKPQPLTDTELQQLILAAIQETDAKGMQAMSKVMEILKPQLLGRAEVAQVSAMVKALLTK